MCIRDRHIIHHIEAQRISHLLVPNTLSSLQGPLIFWHLKKTLFGPVGLVAALSISFCSELFFVNMNIVEHHIFQMSYNPYFYVTQRAHSNQIRNTTPKRVFHILLLIWQPIKTYYTSY